MTRGLAHVSPDKMFLQLNGIEALQCDQQPLRKDQTLPVIAGGWTVSATQIQ